MAAVQLAPQVATSLSDTATPRRSPWIVSPWFDLLFIANVLWPLAVLPASISTDGRPFAEFWMVYFIATPHRWMTLILATFDPDRRYGRGWLFIVVAVGFALLCGGALVYGSLLEGAQGKEQFKILFLFYSLFLGWHFASQHAGVLRMYSRKAGGGIAWLETWGPRVFILYANVRLVSFIAPALRFPWEHLVDVIDYAMFAIPAVLLAVELTRFSLRRVPKLIHLLSFSTLWWAVLWYARAENAVVCNILLVAVTLFHSIEYLAIVTHYGWRRKHHGSPGLFQRMTRNWTVTMIWYIALCGLVYYLFNSGSRDIVFAWLVINTWASFLHVAFDGLMWRLRDPSTARVLDVEISPS
jgi:hypothetical protein